MTGTRRFIPHMAVGVSPGEIEGDVVDFGLVLHGSVLEDGQLHPSAITISDPETGCAVVRGTDRDSALRALDSLVRRSGGYVEFPRLLARKRSEFGKKKESDDQLREQIRSIRRIVTAGASA